MPLTSAFTSRTLVRKFNPNHDANGRFASSDTGKRRGGSDGTPTSDAFGNKLRPNAGATQQSLDLGVKQTVAAHSQRAQYGASHVHGTSDGGLGPDGGEKKQVHGMFMDVNQYVNTKIHEKIPGETVDTYVERQNALLAIRRARRISGSVGPPTEDAFGNPLPQKRHRG